MTTVVELDGAKLDIRDHPAKMSACLRGGGVKNLPNLPMDSCKKLPTVSRGVGVKNLPTS